eukprot:4755121-Prymnesium_polylepis.1
MASWTCCATYLTTLSSLLSGALDDVQFGWIWCGRHASSQRETRPIAGTNFVSLILRAAASPVRYAPACMQSGRAL